MTTAQNFIELFTIPFQAGESKLFMVSGQYFELVDATNPVDVLLLSRNGEQRGIMRGAEASFHLKNTDFQQIQITSASAQTIRIGYGSGEAGTRRAAGAVSIVGTVPVSGPLTDAQLRAASVRTNVELPTATWQSIAASAAGVPQTVWTPAANPNGAIVWAASASEVNATLIHMALLAKASAPATLNDGEMIEASVIQESGASVHAVLMLRQPQRVAAGLGLYYYPSANGAANYPRRVRYTLL